MTKSIAYFVSSALLLSCVAACLKPPAAPASFSSKKGSENSDAGKPESDTDLGDEDSSPSEDDSVASDESEGESGESGKETDIPSKPTVPDIFDVSLDKIDVKNDKGGTALKGDSVVMNLTLKNSGSKTGKVKITPYLTSNRFTDFTNVKLPTQEFSLNGSESKSFPMKIENFFQDLGGTKKEYALNRGAYTLAFDIEADGAAKKSLVKDINGSSFSIEKSNVIFTAVYWHQSYFDKVKYNGGVMKWMEETFSRKGEINNGNSTVKAFSKGFDEMMGVKTVFKAFEGFRLDRNKDFSGSGILHQVSDWSKERLGLNNRFAGTACDSMTHVDNHGFDMEIGLSNDGFGGLAWLCGNTQASGVFDGDPSIDRSQIVLIHETGHNFGAPHCDPIQGFVMCSGEKHQKYAQDGSFVWHTVSIEAMKKKEQDVIRVASFGEAPNGELSMAAERSGSMSQAEIAICNHEHL